MVNPLPFLRKVILDEDKKGFFFLLLAFAKAICVIARPSKLQLFWGRRTRVSRYATPT